MQVTNDLRLALFYCGAIERISKPLDCNAGNTSWRVWLACLNPLQGFPHSFRPHIMVMRKSFPESSTSSSQLTQAKLKLQQQQQQQHQHSMTHAAGWIFSCASALWLQYQLTLLRVPQCDQSWQDLLLPPVATGFWLTAAAAVASDLLGFQAAVTGVEGQRCFCCGNFGIMLADSCNQSADIVKVCLKLQKSSSSSSGTLGDTLRSKGKLSPSSIWLPEGLNAVTVACLLLSASLLLISRG